MTRQEWISELKIRLSIFSEDEVKKVLDYYDELYADMSEQKYYESEIISSFGNPYDIARKIMADYESNFEQICGGARVETAESESTVNSKRMSRINSVRDNTHQSKPYASQRLDDSSQEGFGNRVYQPSRERGAGRPPSYPNEKAGDIPYFPFGVDCENGRQDKQNPINSERIQPAPSVHINNTYVQTEQPRYDNLSTREQRKKRYNAEDNYKQESQNTYFNANTEEKPKQETETGNDEGSKTEKLKRSAKKNVDVLRVFYTGLSRGFQVLFTIIAAVLIFSLTATVVSVAISVAVSFIAFGGGAVVSFVGAIIDAVMMGFSGNTLIAMGISALMVSLVIIALPIAKFLLKWGFAITKWCYAQIKYIWHKGEKTI